MTEHEQSRREILAELAPLIDEHLAGSEWGRALVRVIPAPDGISHRVADIDLHDLFGDEPRVERALGSPSARAMLPVLATACEALCATFGVDVDDVEGGTFIHLAGGGLGFLPGLVRAPSESFERLRDEKMRAVVAKQEGLHHRGVGERFEVDMAAGRIAFFGVDDKVTVRAKAALLGSFSKAARTWVWAWANPSLDKAAQDEARALCDGIPQRDMWEISSPQFATDEGTAWSLCAIVCEQAGAAGLYRAPHPGGWLFLLLRDVE